MPSVLQPWVMELPFMQQSVLLTAVRGPDGVPKYHASKFIVRWYRRSVLISSFAKCAILNPWQEDGGSFYGPSCQPPPAGGDEWEAELEPRVADYMRSLDELPHHFQMHMMHAAEIVGYQHPAPRIAAWWYKFYGRLAHDMHLWPETRAQMCERLGDSRDGWLRRADEATVA